jgi:hypothetical protein
VVAAVEVDTADLPVRAAWVVVGPEQLQEPAQQDLAVRAAVVAVVQSQAAPVGLES